MPTSWNVDWNLFLELKLDFRAILLCESDKKMHFCKKSLDYLKFPVDIVTRIRRRREPPFQSLPCRTGHRPDLFVSNGIRSKKKRRSLDLSKSVWQFFRKNSAWKLDKPSECVVMFRNWSYIHPGGGRSQPNNQIVGEKMYPGAKKVSIFSENPLTHRILPIQSLNTEHRTQNTEHRTQNTEHRTQNTEHRTQNTA